MIFKFIPPKPAPGWARLCFLWVIVIMAISACGGDDNDNKPVLVDPLAAAGQEVFTKNCARCHSLDEGKVIVGPSLNGVASRAATRVDGLTAAEYFHLSITKPNAYLVDGFNDLMPSNLGQLLSEEEIEAVISYLFTLE